MDRRRLVALMALSSMAVVAAAPVAADDTETQALRKEVEELKLKVQKLEAQQGIKGEGNQAATSAPAPATPAVSPASAVTPPTDTAASPTDRARDISSGGQPSETSQRAAPPRAAAAASASGAAAKDKTESNAATPGAASISIPVLRESWSHIAKGMSEADVATTLGAPTTQTLINGKRVWYYYYPGIGGGSVFFKGNGQVSSHQAPFIGWW